MPDLGSATQAPAVQQLDVAVLLQGPALLDVHYLVALGVREVKRRDGINPSPRLVELQRCLASAVGRYRAAVSLAGHADVPDHAAPTGSEHPGPEDLLTTREAAVILNICERHVRRLAPELGGATRRGGVLLFDRGAVEALAATRAEGDR